MATNLAMQVKVRLQTGRMKGLFGSLFAGVSAPLVAVTPQWALMYGAYFWSQNALDSSSLCAETRGALSGLFCGVVVALVQAPVDAVKIKAQNEKLSSVAVLARLVTQKDCLRMVREGVLASAIHNGISQAIFFATYEHVLGRINVSPDNGCPEKRGVVDWRPALAGGISGIVEWTTCMATDNIKTRVQASAGHLRYFDALKLLYKEHGARGFYRGYFPTLSVCISLFFSHHFTPHAGCAPCRSTHPHTS